VVLSKGMGYGLVDRLASPRAGQALMRFGRFSAYCFRPA
jgi:hypothetical protein